MASSTAHIALVAGATRGAGRGIARMLGAAGSTVYCTGRSSRLTGPPASGSYAGRPETIEETAELVIEAGGFGIPVRVDHAVEHDVTALAARIGRDHGRLDLVVMDFWGDDAPVEFGRPFWQLPLESCRRRIDTTLFPHLLTLQTLVPLLLDSPAPSARTHPSLIVEVTEGHTLDYRTNLAFDLAAMLRIRLAYGLAEDLAPRGVTVLAVTPGYMRTESALDRLGVTEANWREGGRQDPHFLESETPCYIGRGVAALSRDRDVARRAGGLYPSWELAEDYGFDDLDGRRPHFGRYFSKTFGESAGPLHTSIRWRQVRKA